MVGRRASNGSENGDNNKGSIEWSRKVIRGSIFLHFLCISFAIRYQVVNRDMAEVTVEMTEGCNNNNHRGGGPLVLLLLLL